MKLKTSILFLFFILFCLSCKKDKDVTAPTITISSPSESQQYNALDTVKVTITVEDETALKQIDITLTDYNKIPVLATKTIVPQDKKVTLTILYPLNDINLLSGTYYIWVKASDGINDQNTYRSINISAVPQVLKYIYIFSFGNSTTVHLLRQTPSGNPQHLFDINGDFSSSAASSKSQLIYSCGKTFGNLHAYNIADNLESWTIPVSSNPPFPYFDYIGCYNNILYVSFYDGYIRGYYNNGSPTITAITPSKAHPMKLCAGSNYLYADHENYSGTSRTFGVYYLTSGMLKQQITTDFQAVEIFEKDDDNVFIFANQSGQGIMELYSISGNGVWAPHTIPTGKINDVLQIDENNYIIAHQSGMYKYQYDNNSLTSYVLGINATSIKYNPTTSEIFASSGSEIMVYDYASHSLINTISVADSIMDFQLLYNRQ